MFKIILFIALCVLVLVECKPSEERPPHRVARQAPPGADMMGQIPGMTNNPMIDQMKQSLMQGAQKAMEFAQKMMQTMSGMLQGSTQPPSATG